MNDQEREILLEARRICSEDGHGVEVVRISTLREGGSGYSVELSLPPVVSPDDPMVRALVPRLESISGVERVQVVLAED